ncbi:MAG TPA: efflux RND transporter periplasmic adaptor subunit, partial [Proteobacteria bacterium]|nr:efflux RND transporter periplasmic adaptor subunit [Pseudomonadota bacterium]
MEGQQVRRGDTLVEVDPAAATQQVAQAQAAVATALAVVEQARQGQVATRDQVGTAIGAAEAAVA